MTGPVNSGTNQYFLNYATSADQSSQAQQAQDLTIAETRKFPSDNESGNLPIGIEPESPQTAVLQLFIDLIQQLANTIGIGFPDTGNGPPLAETLKFPSDNESGNPPPGFIGPPIEPPVFETLKFPSDDESGGLPPVGIEPPIFETLKFPSDDESGGLPPVGIEPPPMETLKYPSDDESGGIPPHCNY